MGCGRACYSGIWGDRASTVRQPMTESDVEAAALGWFEQIGYGVLHGFDVGLEGPASERASAGTVGHP